ncbi:VTT domain-containing protein [Paraburkholderia rhizosphaerae]|uniref:Membrane protein DedA with SNARE-associated domain n=1 Tax=Paraburkholderia rhizosphaerae TaxID=480658 RepID=A0A4R8L989_9BURK|nr:VTT domain-containing protein [Paraburkholderia rhizosphaerae]TDY38728.1 membrane protein DedA with SNARE-associated domain [Paraburkholderia rhizosphaerae]
MIEFPADAVAKWGSALVFLNVLIARLGIPIPAVPLLLFAGVAIVDHRLSFWHVLGAAGLGALTGDSVWFTAGRIFGRRLIHALARLSVTVEKRVRKARALFARFGPGIVAVSKFVPGLAIITPPLMGTTRVSAAIFFAWDALGVTAWATFWLLGGALFERHLRMFIVEVRRHGATAIDVLVVLALIYLLYRLILRWRAQPPFALASVTPEGIDEMLRPALPPMILDARPEPVRQQEPYRLPRVMHVERNSLGEVDASSVERNTVVYCVCPDQETARTLSQQMRDKGFRQVRAIRGGLDAWERRGYAVEPVPTKHARTRDGRDDEHEAKQETSSEVTLRAIASWHPLSST